MNLTLRARLLLLISGVLVISGWVNWFVIQPRYEASVIDERLVILSQIQTHRLNAVEDRLNSWVELMRAAGVQLGTNPQGMETVFKQYIRLFPDLQSMKITEPVTGEFVEIRRSSADTASIDVTRLQFHPVRTDSTMRFSWDRNGNSGGRIILIAQFYSGADAFQLTAVFSESYISQQLTQFGTGGTYLLNLQLPDQLLLADSALIQVEPDFSALSKITSVQFGDRTYVGLTASLRVIPLSHIIVLDTDLINEPVKVLFYRSGLILGITLLVLFAGGWVLTAVIQRPVAQFMEDTKSWAAFQFDKPIRTGTLPEFSSLTTALEEVRKKLAHYQRINVEKIIVEQEKNLLLMQFASEMVAVLDNEDRFVFTNLRFQQFAEQIGLVSFPETFQAFLETEGLKIKEKATDERTQGKFRILTSRLEIAVSAREHDYVMGCERVEIKGENNERIGGMVFLHDLSEDRKVDKMRSEMINLIIHELRNPVTGVLGLSELLLQPGLKEKEKPEFYRLIHSNGKTMSQLINRFLDVARLESNKITIQKKPVDLVQIVRDAADGFLPQARSKQLSLEVSAQQESILVNGSADLLSDAVRNLISNAIKYGPQNRKIDLDLRKNADTAVFSITDHGFGIAAEHMDRVFQKFYRIKDSRINEIGTGLGLPYVKEIIEKHDGKLKLESTPEIGCRFTAFIPSIREGAEAAP